MFLVREMKESIVSLIKGVTDKTSINTRIVSSLRVIGGANELSVYKANSNKSKDIDNAVVSFVVKGDSFPDKHSFVVTQDSFLYNYNLNYRNDDDLTNPFYIGRHLHYEIEVPTLEEEANYILAIRDSLTSPNGMTLYYKHYTQPEITNLIIEKYNKKQIKIKLLKSNFRFCLLNECKKRSDCKTELLFKTVKKDKIEAKNRLAKEINTLCM